MENWRTMNKVAKFNINFIKPNQFSAEAMKKIRFIGKVAWYLGKFMSVRSLEKDKA